MSFLENVHEKIAKTKKNQITLTTIEAYSVWELLVARYDALDRTQLYYEHVKDKDFKLIISNGLDILKEQIKILEKIMNKYGIPLVDRPPKSVSISHNIPMIQDEFIYREIHTGMQNFLDLHNRVFRNSTNKEIRTVFKEFTITEINLFEKFVDYGKKKGWIHVPPPYSN